MGEVREVERYPRQEEVNRRVVSNDPEHAVTDHPTTTPIEERNNQKQLKHREHKMESQFLLKRNGTKNVDINDKKNICNID